MPTNYTGTSTPPGGQDAPSPDPVEDAGPVVQLPVSADAFAVAAFYQPFKTLADWVTFACKNLVRPTAKALGVAVPIGQVWKNSTVIATVYINNIGQFSGFNVTAVADTSAGAFTSYHITLGSTPGARLIINPQAIGDKRFAYVTAINVGAGTFDIQLRDDAGVAVAVDVMITVHGF